VRSNRFRVLGAGAIGLVASVTMAWAGSEPATGTIALGGGASLALAAEARLRLDTFDNAQLARGNDYRQALFRGVVGADLRVAPGLRAFAEIGTGQVEGRRGVATASFRNAASLQQAYVDMTSPFGAIEVGAALGRLEFADGPRQLVSLGDGPNLHRTWNGARLLARGGRFRAAAFDLRATRLARGSFDERIHHTERLRGVTAGFSFPDAGDARIDIDPFWFRSENPGFRSGGLVGRDERDTRGLRVWGRRGGLAWDWTFAHQGGRFRDRRVDAWGLFAVQSLALGAQDWKPRLTSHVDVASGGAYQEDNLTGFNPLYASSAYLGEGQFLGLGNLVLVAPGFAITPTSRTSLAIEYGFARRLRTDDAAYAGGLRAYPGTREVPGRRIGGLLRVSGSWAASANLTLALDYERLAAGDVLVRAGHASGSYAYVGATIRY
jgi:hypothetical protein